MANRFENKVVVITGGSDGIGLATATLFAREGAHVYITGRRQAQLAEALKEIGAGVIGVQGDVGKVADLDRLYARIQRDHGRVDVVFANAGISESAQIGEIEEEHFDRLFSTNVKGLVFTVQKALPLMTAGGTVILAGSGAGSKGFPNLSIYSATKAAIRSLARTWTTDLKTRGIRVNVVSPGAILTPAMETYLKANAAAEEALKQATPFGRLGHTDEVAKAVLFLASSESSFVAGDELFVDGGFVAV
ncbi:SDR family NAD(P)-dependent oxidoreductase [Paraburkholderia caballeronis]|uniref:NAD(P)-dependent dehydrogenase, short-chain alcohol dehydrogenase family n=1 Tax=Paraburkholderia caballeronis TaxID=416943 RepID=A0A1H7W795_9BURK|nr:glucose 1-dehydrogenase [Paraburkholderia caballeronis]PXW13576.1 NAD(P)-dependent dehydrogenase (short-subunit alcohol dehydrogenase family) [Paraburkholderia caballeronis]PXW92325.1 NAD(P)-dependent dehydrogenase (short-subunit alcohol dehydrogenase family) [Paraburkholderia caballeronis]RAJ86574.1 NAD(P)-dependent dehydrogenase (short-subunit alcohol dehydrogenase family) [Paraburkholderia caballeronis]SEC50002.1 NAD(P)-dependent dehydrogenase, short-chain alcohol dehydrogenase family [Pa